MKTIDPKLINEQLNRCFLEYDPQWAHNYNADAHINGFKYYIERIAGLKLDFHPETKRGQFGYRLDGVEIVDEKKFMMFQIQYA